MQRGRIATGFWLLAVATALIGCDWALPDFEGYRPCGDGCPDGCSCLAGSVCVPDREGLAPECCFGDFCPACEKDGDCPNEDCHCERGVCWTQEDAFEPEICGRPRPRCLTNADCEHGCTCDQDGECQPPAHIEDPDFCFHGARDCVSDEDCRTGCSCLEGTCTSPADDPAFGYCAGEGQELTCRGPTYTIISGEDELRGMLLDYADEPGPHGIIFEVPGRELAITRVLPPVTSLTWIQGGSGSFRLRCDGAETGLTVSGTGVVLSDLEIVGCSEDGVRILGGSADVHLFRMRIGERGNPNGNGIRIEDGARRIYVGRGRELGPGRCIGPETTGWLDEGNLAEYDVNVIVANTQDGILAEGVEDLLIEGTWLGFDTIGDRGQGTFERGNWGAGIHLRDVWNAHIGLLHTDAIELDGDLDFRQGCVAVGRSGAGGVHIQGGGDIQMHCLIIGDTPVMDPWRENRGFGMRIEGNQGPVTYGPPPDASGFAATQLGLIHTEVAPLLQIVGNQAPVVIRGAQLQSYWQQAAEVPSIGVDIAGAAAPVEFVHLSLIGNYSHALIRVDGLDDGGEFQFINNVVGDDENAGVPVLEYLADPSRLVMHHNLKMSFGPWCLGECPVDIRPEWSVEVADIADCQFQQMIPLAPGCPMVDRGVDTGMDVNGLAPDDYSGCCPDLGAFECTTDGCVSVNCTPGCP